MISSDILRGYHDIMILSILLENDSYGYEISKEITKRSDTTYTIKETTLYSVFTRLQKNGFVSSYQGGETFGKKRMYYTITDLGRHYYDEKCEEWRLTQVLINQFIRGDERNE